jgi:hypothetical protein
MGPLGVELARETVEPVEPDPEDAALLRLVGKIVDQFQPHRPLLTNDRADFIAWFRGASVG